MNATKQQYQLCAKIKRSLVALHNDEYYKKEQSLRIALHDLFRTKELHTLSKKELLHVLSICSTHTPMALHSIFIYLSKAYVTLTSKK